MARLDRFASANALAGLNLCAHPASPQGRGANIGKDGLPCHRGRCDRAGRDRAGLDVAGASLKRRRDSCDCGCHCRTGWLSQERLFWRGAEQRTSPRLR
jgi:hypothetical protein